MKTKSEEKIESVMARYQMVSPGDIVIVGVSGGADSMCLLHFFNQISSKMRFTILCAHVHHGIRGEEADRDEAFVRDYCEKNEVQFRSVRYDVPKISQETGESVEECGRRLRYEFFASLSEAAKIATAHHLGDSMETVLLNLARGTGLKGLTGIPPVRGRIIRPLITCTREEIEEYLAENNVPYVTDSTNLSDEYARNKIRHAAIPALMQVNPSFADAFIRCTGILSDAEDYLEKKTQESFEKAREADGFSVPGILSLDKAIRDRLLMKIALFYGAQEPSEKHVLLLASVLESGGAVTLPGPVTLSSDGKILSQALRLPPCEMETPVRADCSRYVFPGGLLLVETIDKKQFSLYNNKKPDFRDCGDAACLQNAVFRSRKDGDRFRFPNAEHSKKLKNLFHEKNIRPEDRYGIPMLANANNILWINGIGFSDAAKVTEKTEMLVRITLSH